jgi:glucose-1-phosphate thymidylyltransferase
LYDVGTLDEAKKMGIAEIDKEKKVIGFVEKPPVPKTTLCSIGIYLYTKDTVALFEKYLAEGNSPDKPGEFLVWLHKRKRVEAFVFDAPHHKWYDIGTVETLEKVRGEFSGENPKHKK